MCEWAWVSTPAFVQTPSLADLIKIHLKYHLFKCVLDGLVFASCPFRQIQILILMEIYYIAEGERCQSWCVCFALISFTSQCQKEATLNHQSSLQSVSWRKKATKSSVAAAFCENFLVTKPSPSAPLVVYSKLLTSRRRRSAPLHERASRPFKPGRDINGFTRTLPF